MLIFCLALVFGFGTGAYAGGAMQAISAYLSPGIQVLYNGQSQVVKDANGKTIYG